MANRSKSRGKRPRKQRPGSGSQAAKTPDTAVTAPVSAGGKRKGPAKGSTSGPVKSPLSPRYGESPQAPWHPLPLSELLILGGAIGIVIGSIRAAKPDGFSRGAAPLLVGVLAVVIGSVEVMLREHRSGYRSHATILAALPVIVFHSVVVLGASAFTTFPPLLNIALIAVDIAIYFVCFRILRRIFLDARTRRVSGRPG